LGTPLWLWPSGIALQKARPWRGGLPAMREPVKREEVSRLSPQAASLEFARVLRVWLDSTRGPCIMWNRASSARRRIVGSAPEGALIAWPARSARFIYKESTKAQLLEAKANLLRLRQDIPLADAELAAVEGGVGPMSGCLRHWLTCRRQGDLRRGNSRPNVWCNWNKCATEKA